MPGPQEERAIPELIRTDDLPVGTNLTWRLKTLITSGRLAPSDRLPGVRELATGAGVNANTARAVYRRLEDQGLTVSRQGLGTFVSPYVPVAPSLERFAADVAAEAVSQGIDPRELARALYAGTSPRAGEELLDQSTIDRDTDQAAARATLRGQIARLEASLAPYPEASEEGPQPVMGPQPRLAGIAELEATRDELVEKLKRARDQAEGRAKEEALARLAFERASAEPAAHRWERGSREDMGEPGCGHWHVRPAWGPVGALMNWWRVKISSGCP
jgi:DNA-binding transcriptional regulator YhcF (GntR family)